MANEEALTIDGLAVNDGTTFGMQSFDAPVPRQRQDWIGAADSETQLLVRNPLHENRKITARISVIPQSTMDTAHDKLLLLLDKLQKASRYTDGITMTWAPATGTRTATFDVLAGEITDLPIDWENGYLAKAPTITIELTCKPYWRGTETLTSTASSSTPITTLEIAGVTGDVPALGRLIVTDTATQSRRHVEWGLEGPLTYNNATSLILDSDNLVTTGFAGVQFAGSAYDPNASGNNAIQVTLISGGAVAACGTGNQSHIGSFRVKARVSTANIDNLIRFSYRAGDGPWSSNEWAPLIQANNWIEVDFGTITIPTTLSGTQRWTGQVEMIGAASSPGVMYVDYLLLVPVSDGYGKARASYSPTPGVIAGYDQFTSTTAGSALNARVAPGGGTWATSGDATDFAFVDGTLTTTGELISRSVTSAAGRFALLGTATPSDVAAEVKVLNDVWASNGTNSDQGVLMRWTNSSNFLCVVLRRVMSSGGVPSAALEIRQMVAGVETVLASTSYISSRMSGTLMTVAGVAYSSGKVYATLTLLGATVATADANSTAVAAGGALATGNTGILDRSTFTGARYYDEFAVSTPAAEPVAVYSGRNMQIRYDDVFRQDSTGTYTGRPQSYRGSRFLVPVGTSRVLVKARRNDIEAAIDDQVTDATQIAGRLDPAGPRGPPMNMVTATSRRNP
jgi:hypothetical protein